MVVTGPYLKKTIVMSLFVFQKTISMTFFNDSSVRNFFFLPESHYAQARRGGLMFSPFVIFFE